MRFILKMRSKVETKLKLTIQNQCHLKRWEKRLKSNNGSSESSSTNSWPKPNSCLVPFTIGPDFMESKRLSSFSWVSSEFHHSSSFLTIKMSLMQLLKVLNMICLSSWCSIPANKCRMEQLDNLIQLFRNTRFWMRRTLLTIGKVELIKIRAVTILVIMLSKFQIPVWDTRLLDFWSLKVLETQEREIRWACFLRILSITPNMSWFQMISRIISEKRCRKFTRLITWL